MKNLGQVQRHEKEENVQFQRRQNLEMHYLHHQQELFEESH